MGLAVGVACKFELILALHFSVPTSKMSSTLYSSCCQLVGLGPGTGERRGKGRRDRIRERKGKEK